MTPPPWVAIFQIGGGAVVEVRASTVLGVTDLRRLARIVQLTADFEGESVREIARREPTPSEPTPSEAA